MLFANWVRILRKVHHNDQTNWETKSFCGLGRVVATTVGSVVQMLLIIIMF